MTLKQSNRPVFRCCIDVTDQPFSRCPHELGKRRPSPPVSQRLSIPSNWLSAWSAISGSRFGNPSRPVNWVRCFSDKCRRRSWVRRRLQSRRAIEVQPNPSRFRSCQIFSRRQCALCWLHIGGRSIGSRWMGLDTMWYPERKAHGVY